MIYGAILLRLFVCTYNTGFGRQSFEAHKCAQSFSRDPERSDAKLGKEITSQVPRIDTINGGIKALVV